MNRRLWLVSLLVGCGLASLMSGPAASVRGQSSGLWSTVDRSALGLPAGRAARPAGGNQHTVALDHTLLAELLATAPTEAAARGTVSTAIIELPMPDGTFRQFAFVYSPIMDEQLQAQFPDFKTYSGRAVDDPSTTVHFDWLPTGFHAMILSPQTGTTYIDPFRPDDTLNYVSYYKRDVQRLASETPKCLFSADRHVIDPIEQYIAQDKIAAHPFAGTLRTYRLALAANGEYTAALGGTVPLAMAGIMTTMSRVNGIYEREMSLKMELIGNNSSIVYTNAGTDPYTDNNDGVRMLCDNQVNLNNTIGNANYDIGHVFTTGGGGVAILGSPCNGSSLVNCANFGAPEHGTISGVKAMGVTGLPNPTGDVFAVDFVAHEMGHQWGANHPFNGTTGNCGGGNRNAGTAVEPGSGSTIMGYAGICGAEDLQPNSDDSFHTVSLHEMQTYVSTGNGSTCDATSSTGNTAPTVSAGVDFTIPRSTPFTLVASGSDINGDTLTYSWEQVDLGTAAPPNTDDGSRPIFRSFDPATSSSRTFPQLQHILSGATPPLGESLPTTTRNMNFRVTARDNRTGGGGTNDDQMVLSVTSAAGPFQVTSPNGGGTLSGVQTVTWNVAGTSGAPVSCANVAILFSTDGGNTFPTTLTASTANDGTESVTLPQVTTSTARVMVECGATHKFFDVSNANFSVIPAAPTPTPTATPLPPTPTPTATPLPPTPTPTATPVPPTPTPTSTPLPPTPTPTATPVPPTPTPTETPLPPTPTPTATPLPPTPTPTSTPLPPTPTPTATPLPPTPTPTATPAPPTPTPTATPSAAPVILVNGGSSPITVAPGATVTVDVSNGPGNTRDWVARYLVTAANSNYQTFQYLNGQSTPPASGMTSATLSFAMPTVAGNYNFRFLLNNTYTLLATSATVTVSAPATPTPTPTPTATPTPTPGPAPVVLVNGGSSPITVAPGAVVTVDVSNGPGNTRDWVARYLVTAGNSNYQAFQYLNGLDTPPVSGMTSATLSFTMPTVAGNYNFRFLANNTYVVLATSPTVTISGPPPTPTPTPTPTPGATAVVLVNGGSSPITVAPGAMVTVDVSNGPGNTRDWVARYLVSAANSNYQVYQYLNGQQTPPVSGMTSATLSFAMPTVAGNYNFRFLANNTYTVLATSPTVTVSGPPPTPTPTPTPSAAVVLLVNGSAAPITVARGAVVTVDVSNGPGSATDWVAKYTTAAAPSNYFYDYQYFNGLQTPPASGMTSATLTFTMPMVPGTYNFRCLANNTFTVIGTSPTVTVP